MRVPRCRQIVARKLFQAPPDIKINTVYIYISGKYFYHIKNLSNYAERTSRRNVDEFSFSPTHEWENIRTYYFIHEQTEGNLRPNIFSTPGRKAKLQFLETFQDGITAAEEENAKC
jgi:hypothetical protein